MSHFTGNHRSQRCTSRNVRGAVRADLLSGFLQKSGRTPRPQPVQKTFASPAEAGAAFLEAAKSGDQGALLAIFGPDGKDVLFSGDAVKDQERAAGLRCCIRPDESLARDQSGRRDSVRWCGQLSFSNSSGQNSSGQWSFDTAAGKDEILARRIGKGELTAIAACGALADAEQQYFSQTHDGDKVKQYAQKFVSDEGKQNGLYWQVPEGQAPSPLGPLGDFAKAVGYTNAGENRSRSMATISGY